MNAPSQSFYRRHERTFESYRFVYPVLSRRSRGLSIGVNLNPDKICNFDCVYCQVDRTRNSEVRFVDLGPLLVELETMLAAATSGQIYQTEKFRHAPAELRRLNDIAFSGDGEPTTHRNFDEIVAACAEVKRRSGLHDVKMILITNASMFHRPQVERGLKILDAHQGEIWAKLDAGTEAYYRLIERTTIPFRRILDNIAAAARARPVVIQSLFMRLRGEGPSLAEQEAFCQRLNEITAAGGKISLVQIYSIARAPAESFVAPLPNDDLAALAELVSVRTGLPTVCFPAADE